MVTLSHSFGKSDDGVLVPTVLGDVLVPTVLRDEGADDGATVGTSSCARVGCCCSDNNSSTNNDSDVKQERDDRKVIDGRGIILLMFELG